MTTTELLHHRRQRRRHHHNHCNFTTLNKLAFLFSHSSHSPFFHSAFCRRPSPVSNACPPPPPPTSPKKRHSKRREARCITPPLAHLPAPSSFACLSLDEAISIAGQLSAACLKVNSAKCICNRRIIARVNRSSSKGDEICGGCDQALAIYLH